MPTKNNASKSKSAAASSHEVAPGSDAPAHATRTGVRASGRKTATAKKAAMIDAHISTDKDGNVVRTRGHTLKRGDSPAGEYAPSLEQPSLKGGILAALDKSSLEDDEEYPNLPKREPSWDSNPHPNSLRRTPDALEQSQSRPRPRPIAKKNNVKNGKKAASRSADVISIHDTDSDVEDDNTATAAPERPDTPLLFDMEAVESGSDKGDDGDESERGGAFEETEEDKAFIDDRSEGELSVVMDSPPQVLSRLRRGSASPSKRPARDSASPSQRPTTKRARYQEHLDQDTASPERTKAARVGSGTTAAKARSRPSNATASGTKNPSTPKAKTSEGTSGRQLSDVVTPTASNSRSSGKQATDTPSKHSSSNPTKVRSADDIYYDAYRVPRPPAGPMPPPGLNAKLHHNAKPSSSGTIQKRSSNDRKLKDADRNTSPAPDDSSPASSQPARRVKAKTDVVGRTDVLAEDLPEDAAEGAGGPVDEEIDESQQFLGDIDNEWLKELARGLPSLKEVVFDKTSRNQSSDDPQADRKISLDSLFAELTEMGRPDLNDRIRTLLSMPSTMTYVNPVTIDPRGLRNSRLKNGSRFLNVSYYRPTKGASPNACLLMTGIVAYSYMTADAVIPNSFTGRSSRDHRIGIAPLEYIFQRSMTVIATGLEFTEMVYPFAQGCMPFSTKAEYVSNDESNIVVSPTKASLLSGSSSRLPSGANRLDSLMQNHSYPLPLRYEDKVPCYDVRAREHDFSAAWWTKLWRMPIWAQKEIPIGALVTVGFTANSFPVKSNLTSLETNHLSTNLQFVLVHSSKTSS
ncbi:hypothetical protein BKA70DRAFT_1223558 [Coprinopsis sp. MPI-PUGE-AT-0042]|nr:hypothetical protein BKA70DRAFT_1223558 [Coprinopsis sp. MPI-PUGE-AT-0042]